MALEAVIFDKDGVLVDSEQGKCRAMERALASFGYRGIDGFNDWFFSRVGVPGLESSQMCVSRFSLSVDPKALYDKTEEIRRGMLDTEPAPLISSSIAFLKAIHSTFRNVKIGIASSDFPKNIRKHMEQAGVLEYVDAMTSGEKSSGEVTRDKPHPDVYLVTAKKLGVNPRFCIGVEDTALGIQAVKAAGMYCIAYMNPNSGRQDYSQADKVADDLSKITLREIVSAFI